MKHFVLTFLSTAAVCAVLSTTPAAAQETITGAPARTAPVTIAGYGDSSGYTVPSASNRGPAYAIQSPNRCHVIRDMENTEGRYTSVCDF
jgi:hypothetical protein